MSDKQRVQFLSKVRYSPMYFGLSFSLSPNLSIFLPVRPNSHSKLSSLPEPDFQTIFLSQPHIDLLETLPETLIEEFQDRC